MEHYDLVIVGAGSGNMLPGPEFEGWRIAIVERDRFGGTCLNRGCIPSKVFVYTADVAEHVRQAARFDVTARLDSVDWPAIRDRVFAPIDPAHASAIDYRRRTGTAVYEGTARFVAPKVLDVDGERITGERIVLAAGARPMIPDIPGLDGVPFHTSDTIMRLDALPPRLAIIGGGFIAAELGHVFQALGSHVSIVQRSDNLLTAEDDDVSRRFTEIARGRFDLRTGAQVIQARQQGSDITLTVSTAKGSLSEMAELTVDVVLVATGRIPNSDLLDAAAGGIAVDDHGHVIVDEYLRTSVEGVFAFGDLSNHLQLKHIANAEGRAMRHNLLHPDDLRIGTPPLAPHAVFADPQVATVGLTERAARASGRLLTVAVRDYSHTAYGWALRDTTSFVKLIADAETRLLLGAHIIGPQAATLIQPLVQAMTFGQTVDQLAHDVIYIHPALTEAVEQALLEL